jgi:hypothetical protein
MTRDFRREIRMNWSLMAIAMVGWVIMLLAFPERITLLLGIAPLILVGIVFSYRHQSQVKAGKTPEVIPAAMVRWMVPLGISLGLTIVLLVAFIDSNQDPLGILLLVAPVAVLIVALVLANWLRK